MVQDVRALAACFWLVTGAGGAGCSCYFADVSKIVLTPSILACSLPFGCFVALCSVCCLQICPYFAILGGFGGVLWWLCGFVLLACFAWLVGLLCACGVRRFYGLWRVCLSFFLLCCCFYALCPRLSCLSSCLVFPFLLWLCSCFFPFGCTDKKKGREGLPLASSLVVLWVCCYSIAASGIRKLLQAVSILRFFPAIHATVK